MATYITNYNQAFLIKFLQNGQKKLIDAFKTVMDEL